MNALLINSRAELNGRLTDTTAKDRPKILHMITSLDIGGTERQAVQLLNSLNEDHFDIRLALLHRRGALLDHITKRFHEIHEFPLTCFYNGNAARQLMRLRRLLVREQVAILHAHDFYAGVLGSAAARLTNTLVVASQRHLRLSEQKIHELGQRFIHKLAHKILVNSNAIRDHIISESKASPHKIILIYNGLNAIPDIHALRVLERAKLRNYLGLNGKATIIGSVARLQPVKGHRYLIDAVARVIPAVPDVHLVLVGDGSLRDEIRSQAERLGIGSRVHLLGDRNDSAQIVAGFDLAVLASLHEGLPNAVMEAMAVAVPVVATAVGGIKELIIDSETGFLAQPADAEALAEKIYLAITHRDQSQLFALRGRQFMLEQFSVRRMVESVENLYREMLQKHAEV